MKSNQYQKRKNEKVICTKEELVKDASYVKKQKKKKKQLNNNRYSHMDS